MWIEVKDVIGEELQGVKVRFATDYGVCEGLWQGRPPNASTRYEAEISIDDELVWGHTVLQTDKEEYSIYCDDQTYVLQGKLERVFADGTSALHIGRYPFTG